MEMNGLDELTELIPVNRCDGLCDRPCLDQIKSTMAKVARDSGYNRWSYTQFSCVSAASDMPSTFLTTIDKDWEARYIEKQYHRIDPVVRCSDTESDVFLMFATWERCKREAMLRPLGSTAREKKQYMADVEAFFRDAESYGYRSGIVASMNIGLDRVTCSAASGLSPADHDKTVDDRLWKYLRSAIVIVHELVDSTMGCSSCGQGERVNFSISEPEARWLQAALENPFSTNYEIAARSARSVDTLNTQLTALRKKLGLPRANPFVLALYCRQKGLLPENVFSVIDNSEYEE